MNVSHNTEQFECVVPHVPAIWDNRRTERVCPSKMTLRIETTNCCNFRCTFCPHASLKRSRGFMDDRIFEKIITEGAAAGFRKAFLSNFGEPLLDKKLARRIAFAKQAGFSNIAIFSNGSRLTSEWLSELAKAGLTTLNLSLSPIREFAETRPGVCVEEFIESLRTLRDNPDRKIIAVNYIKTGRSLPQEEKEFLAFLASIGLRLFSTFDEHNWGRDDSASAAPRVQNYLCPELWVTLNVIWTGQVQLCCVDQEGEYVLGNLAEDSITDVLESEAWRRIRSNHLKGQFLAKCAKCDVPAKAAGRSANMTLSCRYMLGMLRMYLSGTASIPPLGSAIRAVGRIYWNAFKKSLSRAAR
ncbi:MAG: radical SAM protein [Kiritimatiellae bacterium]|nr:radical SAM protein [Kiritimatiellia bacterium]